MSYDGPRNVFKLLCPDVVANAILAGGAQIKEQWQRETGTKIVVSGPQELFPGTQLRTLFIGGNSPEQLVPVLDAFVGLSQRCGDKEGNEYVIRAAIPSKTASAVIGPGGCNVQALRKTTGARTLIEKVPFSAHQLVKVTGLPGGLQKALRMVNEQLQGEVINDWYFGWAAVRVFDPSEGQQTQSWYDGWSAEFAGCAAAVAAAAAAEGAGTWLPPEADAQPVGPVAVAPPGRARSRTPPRRPRTPPRGGRQAGGRQETVTAMKAEPMEGVTAEPSEVCSLSDHDQAMLGVIREIATKEPLSCYILEEEQSLSVELPLTIVEAMRGPGDQFMNKVQKAVGVRIRYEAVVDEDVSPEEAAELCTIVIEGTLFEVYRAHALLMRRYHNVADDNGDIRDVPMEADDVDLFAGPVGFAPEPSIDDPSAMIGAAGAGGGGAEDDGEAAMKSELADLEARLAMVRSMKQTGAAGAGLAAAAAQPASFSPVAPRPAALRVVAAPKQPPVVAAALRPRPPRPAAPRLPAAAVPQQPVVPVAPVGVLPAAAVPQETLVPVVPVGVRRPTVSAPKPAPPMTSPGRPGAPGRPNIVVQFGVSKARAAVVASAGKGKDGKGVAGKPM